MDCILQGVTKSQTQLRGFCFTSLHMFNGVTVLYTETQHGKSTMRSVAKESTCHIGDVGSIPGLGRSPGEGNGYPLQYSGLENSMDCVIQGIMKSRT